jgi:hypothetical protein
METAEVKLKQICAAFRLLERRLYGGNEGKRVRWRRRSEKILAAESRRRHRDKQQPEPVPAGGRCKHCGCTEERACLIGRYARCSWVNAERTVCSRRECVQAEIDRILAKVKVAA